MKNGIQQTIGVIKSLYTTTKQRLLSLLAGSLEKTDVVSKNINKRPNIMKAIDFVHNNYIWITGTLLASGIILDIFLPIANPTLVPFKQIDPITLKVVITNNYVFERGIVLLHSISTILYGLAVSIFILIFLDKKFEERQREQTKHLTEQKEFEHKKELDELHDKISKNIFDGVLKKFIPEPLFNKFKNEIFDIDLVRMNAKWFYEIERNEFNSFNVTHNISYELHNLNNYVVDLELPITINDSNVIFTTKTKSIKGIKSNGIVDGSVNVDNRHIKIEPNDYYSIILCIENKYKTKAVLDTHNTKFSIIGLEITTSQPKDVNVRICPSFTDKLKLHPTTNTVTQYEKIDCILKGQGITYIIEEIDAPIDDDIVINCDELKNHGLNE